MLDVIHTTKNVELTSHSFLDEIFNYPCKIVFTDYSNHGCETTCYDSIKDAESKTGISSLAIWASLTTSRGIHHNLGVHFGTHEEIEEFKKRASKDCKDA